MGCNRADYDVMILGAGYTGSLCATLLARKGYSVAIVDGAAMPRYAIGEGTTAEQNRCHAYFGRQYKVPELVRLSSYVKMKQAGVPVAIWPKEGFYFLSNTPAFWEGTRRLEPETLFQTVPWPVGPDYHCLRSDYDLYLLNLAHKYGACYYPNTRVRDVSFDGGVQCRIEDSDGARDLTGRFLVDATGFGRFLARKLELVEPDPGDVPLRSRTIYNLFLGVKQLETSYGKDWPRHMVSRDHGTKHMVWREGWAWIIPFENGLTSVGVQLNMDRDTLNHSSLEPRDAFWHEVNKHPAFAAMMDDAVPVRPWTRSERMQWRARQMIGERWAMLPPSCGFSDPLFSPGMALGAVAIGRLLDGIDLVLQRGVPATTALTAMEERYKLETTYISRLQHMLYESFPGFEVMCEVLTLYRLAVFVGGLNVSGNNAHPWFQSLWGFDNPALREMVDEAYATLLKGRKQDLPDKQLAEMMRRTIARTDAFGYVGSTYNRPHTPHFYYNPLIPLLRWTWNLKRSPDAQVAQGARSGVAHWFGNLARYGVTGVDELATRLADIPPLEQSKSVGTLALRHLGILLSRVR